MAFVFLLFISLFPRITSSDISADKAQCADQLVGLSTCLTYVGGNAKNPTPDCCSGLKQVVGKSPKCLCLLIKDHDDPQIGIQINITRALSLPKDCNAPQNISECSKVLKLAPDSKDADIFKQAGNTSTDSQAKGNAKDSAINQSQNLVGSISHSLSLEWKKRKMELVVTYVVILLQLFHLA